MSVIAWHGRRWHGRAWHCMGESGVWFHGLFASFLCTAMRNCFGGDGRYHLIGGPRVTTDRVFACMWVSAAAAGLLTVGRSLEGGLDGPEHVGISGLFVPVGMCRAVQRASGAVMEGEVVSPADVFHEPTSFVRPSHRIRPYRTPYIRACAAGSARVCDLLVIGHRRPSTGHVSSGHVSSVHPPRRPLHSSRRHRPAASSHPIIQPQTIYSCTHCETPATTSTPSLTHPPINPPINPVAIIRSSHPAVQPRPAIKPGTK